MTGPTARGTIVADTPVELAAPWWTRRNVLITCVTTSDPGGVVYVGGPSVSADDGYPLRARDRLRLDLAPDAALFAVVSIGTADVRVLETSD